MNKGFDKWKGYSASAWKEELAWKCYDIAKIVIRAIHAVYKSSLKLFDTCKPFDMFNLIDKVYMIHLPNRIDRYKKIKRRLSKLKLTTGETLFDRIEIIDGVPGNAVDWDDHSVVYPDYTFEQHWNIDPQPHYDLLPYKDEFKLYLSDAERGVCEAHYNTWKQFYDSKAKSALIIEDDIALGYNFSKKFQRVIEQAPKDWDLIYLSSLPNEYGFRWKEYSEDLVRVYNGVWWLSGYMISRKFARKLLKNAPIDGPVDVWINYMFKGSKVFLCPNSIIDQAEDTESDNEYSFATKFRPR